MDANRLPNRFRRNSKQFRERLFRIVKNNLPESLFLKGIIQTFAENEYTDWPMKNRRKFLKNSLIAAGAVALSGPLMAVTTGDKDEKTKPFPGIIYTEKEQGHWDGKAPSHVPKVTVEGNEVKLHTFHPMTQEHYIVRHTLVDESGKVLGSKTFYPTDVQPISTFELPSGFHGKLYATSFCNKHDFWMKEFTV